MLRDIFITILLAIFINACASSGDIIKLDELYFKNKDLESSYSYAKRYADDDFLWAFQSGILAYQNADFKTSIELLNKGEQFFEEISGESGFESAFKTLAIILSSNGIFKYEGSLYEAVLINHYKALDYMMSGDYINARVEFNRANDRQRRSKDYFSAKIDSINESINSNKDEYEEQNPYINTNQTYKQANDIYLSKYGNLSIYKGFSGYINPSISYISGIFFLIQRDYSKASSLLKESYGIANKKQILEDLAILQKRKNRQDSSPYTWIMIEDGAIPKKYEMRFDMPLFLLNSKVLTFNIALPNIATQTSPNKTYRADSTNSFLLVNMNDIVLNEFNIELPYIITTSILSSSYKAYLQYQLGESFGILGAIGGSLFSTLSTNADIRNSRILPLNFHILRVKNNDFSLYANNMKLRDFSFESECSKDSSLCKSSDNIVYLRIFQNDIISILIHNFRRK